MHPIAFLEFNRDKLTAREAQLLEGLLWIAAEMPRQLALQTGQSIEQAARTGAVVAFNMLANTFPDIDLRVRETPLLPEPPVDPPPASSARPTTTALASVSLEPSDFRHRGP